MSDKPVTFVTRGFSDLSVDPDVVKEKPKKGEDSGHQQLLPGIAKDLKKKLSKVGFKVILKLRLNISCK
jgi:hypothetical protein